MNGPTRPSRDLVWPPPQEELDALEVVHLSPASPATSGTAAPLAESPPLVEPTPPRPRGRLARIAATAVLMLLAMMVGVWLGARHARRSIAVADYSPPPTRESAPAAREHLETPAAPGVPASPTSSPAPPSEPSAPAPPAASASLTSSSPAPPPPPNAVSESMAARSAVDPPPSTPTPSAPTLPDTPLPEAQPLTDVPGAIGALPPPAVPARRAGAAPISTSGPDEAGVKRTLAEYQRAYDTLDANAAAARWPSVDVAALARAFSSLKSQSLVFDRCRLLVGTSTAMAMCTGSATVVRQVGSARPVMEPLQWTFKLRRATGNDWVIDSVLTTR